VRKKKKGLDMVVSSKNCNGRKRQMGSKLPLNVRGNNKGKEYSCKEGEGGGVQGKVQECCENS